MVFKRFWEKSNEKESFDTSLIEKMCLIAYPEKKVLRQKLLSQGCVNFNYLVHFNDDTRLVLRVYTRNPKAGAREKSLSKLLESTLPIPKVLFLGRKDQYTFAFMEYMEGITLSELLLDHKDVNLSSIMYTIGSYLGALSKHCFPKGGFFGANLDIEKESKEDELALFAKKAFSKARSTLDKELCKRLEIALEKGLQFQPSYKEANLVHGDFDPANILVKKENDQWVVSGILDWEFAFAGSYLWDIANMLRYAHQMPSEHKESFINGILSCSINLPKNWQQSICFLNILSLLDCLNRADPNKSPRQCEDIKKLLLYFTSALEKGSKKKSIKVCPYDPSWPKVYDKEKKRIEPHIPHLSLHHIGSTSIPKLYAKPIIDILGLSDDLNGCIEPLQNLGYRFRGEQNIPLHYYFTREVDDMRFNLHIAHENSGFTHLNLSFRNYLREHDLDRERYSQLKRGLLKDPNSADKTLRNFSNYNLGKDAFIKEILSKAKFNKHCLNFCMHDSEWKAFHRICERELFSHLDVDYDPKHPSFYNPSFYRFVLYKGSTIVSIGCIESVDSKIAALRFIATDAPFQRQGHGKAILKLLEKWCQLKGFEEIKLHAYTPAISFYKKFGYTETEFDDTSINEKTLKMGKKL